MLLLIQCTVTSFASDVSKLRLMESSHFNSHCLSYFNTYWDYELVSN